MPTMPMPTPKRIGEDLSTSAPFLELIPTQVYVGTFYPTAQLTPEEILGFVRPDIVVPS